MTYYFVLAIFVYAFIMVIYLDTRINKLAGQIAELKLAVKITRNEANLPPVRFIGEPE